MAVDWGKTLTRGITTLEFLHDQVEKRLGYRQIMVALRSEGVEISLGELKEKLAQEQISLKGHGGGSNQPISLSKMKILRARAKGVSIGKGLKQSSRAEDTTEDSTDKLESLSARDCHWPLGEPDKGQQRYCGRNAKRGSPYCEAHARKAYQPRASKKQV